MKQNQEENSASFQHTVQYLCPFDGWGMKKPQCETFPFFFSYCPVHQTGRMLVAFHLWWKKIGNKFGRHVMMERHLVVAT